MKRILHLTILCALLSGSIGAQVTIGSGQKPNTGALLDLKDDGTYNNGETASKGLGLPRVELTTISPATGDLAASIGGTGNWDETAHTGLIVYNVKDETFNPTTCKAEGAPVGLYVWDGTTWVGLGIQGDGGTNQFTETFNPITDTGTVTDYEGNVYPTKRWTSTDGLKISGIWMTKNLYSIRKADGTLIDCPNGMRLNPAYNNTADGAVVVMNAMPVGTVGSYTNAGVTVSGQSYADFAKDFGLSYTHEQALYACPKGWWLPDDYDWNLLAESMDGIKSGRNYNNIGHVMKTRTNKIFTSTDGSPNNWTNGTTVTENGFDALPSGYVLADGTSTSSFSSFVFWWSASTSGSSRYLYHSGSGLISHPASAGRYFVVRCVKG